MSCRTITTHHFVSNQSVNFHTTSSLSIRNLPSKAQTPAAFNINYVLLSSVYLFNLKQLLIKGWRDFWTKILTHVLLYQIVMGPQFQNFTLKCCFLTWCMGLRKFDHNPKMGTNTFLKTFLEPAWGECLFRFFKCWKWRDKYFDLLFVQVKIHFVHFGGLKTKFLKKFIFNFDVKGRFFEN